MCANNRVLCVNALEPEKSTSLVLRTCHAQHEELNDQPITAADTSCRNTVDWQPVGCKCCPSTVGRVDRERLGVAQQQHNFSHLWTNPQWCQGAPPSSLRALGSMRRQAALAAAVLLGLIALAAA